MEPKGAGNEIRSLTFRFPKRFENTAALFCRFGEPFWLPQATFSPSWGPFGLPLDAFSETFGSFHARNRSSTSPIKDLIASGGEISPRSCRDSAENVPRTLQEPAENPPYEPQTKLPFTLRLLRKDFVLPQTLRQNRLE